MDELKIIGKKEQMILILLSNGFSIKDIVEEFGDVFTTNFTVPENKEDVNIEYKGNVNVEYTYVPKNENLTVKTIC
jgi:hypothetical protein